MRNRFGKAVRKIVDVSPPTARGWLLAAVAGLGLWRLGYGAMDLVIFTMSLAGLALVGAAVAGVSLASLYARRRVRAATAGPQVLEAEAPQRTGFRVAALLWMPGLQLTWEWVEPPGVEVRVRRDGAALVEEALPRRRCLLQGVVRRFAVADVFGLARVRWQRAEGAPIAILPAARRLESLPVLLSLGNGDGNPHPAGAPHGDRMDIRRYAVGDSARDILWRVFARTRQLNVRLPERAVTPARKTRAYLVAGGDDEPAAAAARVALQKGTLGADWLFGADGSDQATTEIGEALQMIARSGSPAPPNGHARPGLAEFVAAAPGGDFHCVVFAPARAGEWVGRCAEVVRRHPGALSFVLATDGVTQPRQRRLWQRLLWRETPAPGTPREELTGLVRALARAGAAVTVVDRASGRAYDHARLGMSGTS